MIPIVLGYVLGVLCSLVGYVYARLLWDPVCEHGLHTYYCEECRTRWDTVMELQRMLRRQRQVMREVMREVLREMWDMRRESQE